MKNFLILLTIFISINSFSQEKESDKNTVKENNYKVLEETVPDWELDEKNKALFSAHEVDVKPDFPEGIEKFKLYISNKIKIPKAIRDKKN